MPVIDGCESAKRLAVFLRNRGKLAVALSGGSDSSVLLAFAAYCLGKERCLALTVDAPYMVGKELESARRVCERLGVRHVVCRTAIPELIRSNPPQRCYFCKRSVFSMLQQRALDEGFEWLADGTNVDDLGDFRPGMQAIKELEVLSPFLECGIGKDSIKALGSMLDVPMEVVHAPAGACLLTRLEHGKKVTEEMLRRVEAAEDCLQVMGFLQCRVRVHGDALARIELSPDDVRRAMEASCRERIVEAFRKLGFRHISLDMGGYERGSMNMEGV